jgi:hypothetical protein
MAARKWLRIVTEHSDAPTGHARSISSPPDISIDALPAYVVPHRSEKFARSWPSMIQS